MKITAKIEGRRKRARANCVHLDSFFLFALFIRKIGTGRNDSLFFFSFSFFAEEAVGKIFFAISFSFFFLFCYFFFFLS